MSAGRALIRRTKCCVQGTPVGPLYARDNERVFDINENHNCLPLPWDAVSGPGLYA